LLSEAGSPTGSRPQVWVLRLTPPAAIRFPVLTLRPFSFAAFSMAANLPISLVASQRVTNGPNTPPEAGPAQPHNWGAILLSVAGSPTGSRPQV